MDDALDPGTGALTGPEPVTWGRFNLLSGLFRTHPGPIPHELYTQIAGTDAGDCRRHTLNSQAYDPILHTYWDQHSIRRYAPIREVR